MRSDHLSERVDLRSYYLRLKKNIWLPLIIAAIGAVGALLIYFLSTTVFGPGRLYRAESRLYINFSPAMAQSAYPYYNDYTWRDLVVTDEILNETLNHLREQGFTISEESDLNDMGSRVLSAAEVKASTYVTLPSDIRLMVAQFTNHDPVIANALMEATDAALVRFGETQKEFDSIEIRAEDVAQIVTYTDRRVVALGTGAVIGLLIGIFVLLVRELFNEAVMTPEEAAERFRLPVLGILMKEPATDDVAVMLERDLTDALRGVSLKDGTIRRLHVIAADMTDGLRQAQDVATRLRKRLPPDAGFEILAAAAPGEANGAPAGYTESDGALLAVRTGIDRATMTRRCIRMLRNSGAKISGILLTEAESAFFRAYYHRGRGEA